MDTTTNYTVKFTRIFESSLHLKRCGKQFWSVEAGQTSGGHRDCTSLILPVARVGPSDLRPILLERITTGLTVAFCAKGKAKS